MKNQSYTVKQNNKTLYITVTSNAPSDKAIKNYANKIKEIVIHNINTKEIAI